MRSQQPLSSQHKRKTAWGALLFGALLLASGFFVLANRQYIVDSVSFWQYEPPQAIVEIVANTSMTDDARFIFYAMHPSIDGSRTFNAKCDRKEQTTAVLGCYTGNKIYIYDVNDERLKGIKEVTAVHEMLHAVYERMSSSDKERIDALVESEYAKLRTEERFSDRMDFYARTEPGERSNELHSIIGTEIASISNELEAHYKKYLHDRSRIVGYYDTYHQTFAQLESQANELQKQLDALSQRIKTATSEYNTDAKQLNVDIEEFNARAQKGDFVSQAAFNAERAAMITRSNRVSTQRQTINSLIIQYNELKDTYNDTVTQSNDLYKSIDSNLAPAPTV